MLKQSFLARTVPGSIRSHRMRVLRKPRRRLPRAPLAGRGGAQRRERVANAHGLPPHGRDGAAETRRHPIQNRRDQAWDSGGPARTQQAKQRQKRLRGEGHRGHGRARDRVRSRPDPSGVTGEGRQPGGCVGGERWVRCGARLVAEDAEGAHKDGEGGERPGVGAEELLEGEGACRAIDVLTQQHRARPRRPSWHGARVRNRARATGEVDARRELSCTGLRMGRRCVAFDEPHAPTMPCHVNASQATWQVS